MKTLNQTNKQIEQSPLEYYLKLQYPITLYPDIEGGYVAQIKDWEKDQLTHEAEIRS